MPRGPESRRARGRSGRPTPGTGAGDAARSAPWARARCATLLLALVAVGCSSVREVPVRSLAPEGTGRARVVLRDGYSYAFRRVYPRNDSLVGVYHLVEERIGAGGDIAYVDVERETVLPAASVAHVEMRRLDLSKSLLMGAGAVIAGIYVVRLFEGPEKPDSKGGKGNPLD